MVQKYCLHIFIEYQPGCTSSWHTSGKSRDECGLSPLPKFYRGFVPQAIERVLALDNERLEIVRALGRHSETDFEYSKKWYGGQAPAMNSVIEEAGLVLEENLFETGRTLASLGLARAPLNRIVEALNGN
ncbi:D-vitopine dehydrogenase [Agrobacterium vitis]|uniref:D-vitopine dehydrogenase n=1 Tax=Agrobacterium vitis TaxID=373 RepID=A0A2Z2Q6I0_AGRVI|nr:NAD/NADP octopine/nopaline dehydrogenase family protein [Agrobacterium vitis]ASK49735.1 D-vitopine dehydrogenase [Agrobacterium vitis]MCF1496429.1 D-vitopine dehydrogenase [Allorhizobium ampelinum]